ncbi:transcriptional regulator [Brevibacillus porteri]|uniref:Transcriptional regulator n=1 Tax=Brevibacillus porteri TaxID=2126350 RepID=A0ABX5FG26_9BACL|nr:transcriptional regulator [Brevibacillus porteri]
MFGLGKKRSRLGKWIDQRGVTQQWLCKEAGINKDTATKAASSDDYSPNLKTANGIIRALRKIDPNVRLEDFWSM